MSDPYAYYYPTAPTPGLGEALPRAYEKDHIIDVACTTCRAEPGSWCTDPSSGATKRIPHAARARRAYITHNPCGRERHATRAQHLASWRERAGEPEPQVHPAAKSRLLLNQIYGQPTA